MNIGHELVRSPLILFLDEPTSGLSSVDSEYVVDLLRELCKERKTIMLMTIHQPSEIIFNQLDKLLLLNLGGNVAYFGSPGRVTEYFGRYSEENTEVNPAEYVLRVLDSWKSDKKPEAIYREECEKKPEEPAGEVREEEEKEAPRHF